MRRRASRPTGSLAGGARPCTAGEGWEEWVWVGPRGAILAAAPRQAGRRQLGAAGPAGRSLCTRMRHSKCECDICGKSFDPGHAVSIPGASAGMLTRGEACAMPAELSDAKAARTAASHGGPAMEAGLARNLRTATRDGGEVRVDDRTAEDGMAGADFHERDEVSARRNAGRRQQGGAAAAGNGGEDAEEGQLAPGVREGGAGARGGERTNPARHFAFNAGTGAYLQAGQRKDESSPPLRQPECRPAGAGARGRERTNPARPSDPQAPTRARYAPRGRSAPCHAGRMPESAIRARMRAWHGCPPFCILRRPPSTRHGQR